MISQKQNMFEIFKRIVFACDFLHLFDVLIGTPDEEAQKGGPPIRPVLEPSRWPRPGRLRRCSRGGGLRRGGTGSGLRELHPTDAGHPNAILSGRHVSQPVLVAVSINWDSFPT